MMALAKAVPSGVAGEIVAMLGLVRTGGGGRMRAGEGGAKARACGLAGAAALLALPPLIALSVALKAPLAAPASIALGYLGAASAMAGGDRQRADAWSAGVLVTLIAWTVLSFMVASRDADGPWAAGALLAALFAAAPALAGRSGPAPADAGSSAAPGRRVPVQAPRRVPPVPTAPFADAYPRLRNPEPEAAGGCEPQGMPSAMDLGAATDLVAAARFAIGARDGRDARPAARLDAPPRCFVQCDERGARRVVAAALALARSLGDPAAVTDVVVRQLKGAVLLRLAVDAAWAGRNGAVRPDGEPALRGLQALVEAAGGSVVRTTRNGRSEISIRLAPGRRSPDGSAHGTTAAPDVRSGDTGTAARPRGVRTGASLARA